MILIRQLMTRMPPVMLVTSCDYDSSQRPITLLGPQLLHVQ